jgi:hypothetical protein
MAYGKTKKGLKKPTRKRTLKTKTYASKRRRKK